MRLRRTLVIVLLVTFVIVGLLAAVFVPVSSASNEIQIAPGEINGTSITIPHAAWVSVHLDPRGKMAMTYGMDGSNGRMFDHAGRMGRDSYSFSSWGGTYRGWAEMLGEGPGSTSVWVNVTWGLL
jgi:hypothetical protein